MPLSEMEKAVDEAKAVLARARLCIPAMLRLCRGNLHTLNDWHDLGVLADIKRELRDFNPQRRTWRNRS